MTDICCVGIGVKSQTRAVVFKRNKHTMVVDEWRRQVLLPTSRFLDYLSSQNRRNRLAYCMESILTTQTSEEGFLSEDTGLHQP